MGWVRFTWNLLLSCSGGTSWGRRQDQEEVRKCRSCAGCITCTSAPMPRCFNAVNIFQVVKEKGQKQRLTFFTRFTVVDFIWLYLKIQQSAILIPKSTTDDTSCRLGSAKADTQYGKLGLDNEFKGDTCWMWSFQVSNKAVSTKESGHSCEELTDTCKQLQLRHICCPECSCTVWSFGGVFVSLHIANRVSGPALRGRLSSKLVLNRKL